MRPRPVSLAAALAAAVLALSACSSPDPDPEPEPARVQVEVEGPAALEETTEEQAADPSADPERSVEEGPAGATDEAVVDTHTTPAEPGAPVPSSGDIGTPMPQGLTLEQWEEAFYEGRDAAGTYMRTRFELSHTDPDPNMWLVESRPLVTDRWYDELERIIAVSGGVGQDEWERMKADEVEYHLQILDPVTLDTTAPFGKDEMTLQVPYRFWETSVYAPNPPFDTQYTGLGAEGNQFTSIRLVRDHAAGTWLVDSQGEKAVTGLAD